MLWFYLLLLGWSHSDYRSLLVGDNIYRRSFHTYFVLPSQGDFFRLNSEIQGPKWLYIRSLYFPSIFSISFLIFFKKLPLYTTIPMVKKVMHDTFSILDQDFLVALIMKYKIKELFHPMPLPIGTTINHCWVNQVSVYHQLLQLGLHLPSFPPISEICHWYGICVC